MKIEGISYGKEGKKCPQQKRASKEICYENSVMNLFKEGRAKLRRMARENKRPLYTIPENSVAVFDNNCPDYEWLRSGWITKERVKPNNRLYRCYYDPVEQMYNTRYAVDCMCADIEKDHGLITLDKQ